MVGSQVIIPHKNCSSFSEDGFHLANSEDPDEMLHNAVFHLGHHCLPSVERKNLGVTRV